MRYLLEIDGKGGPVVDTTMDWWAWYCVNIKCDVCSLPGPRWFDRERPGPIDVELVEAPANEVACIDGGALVMSARLWDVLSPYSKGMEVGRVRIITSRGSRVNRDFVSLMTPPRWCIHAQRGLYCRQKHCEGCDNYFNRVGWAKSAAIRREMDERRVYQARFTAIFIDEALRTEHNLRERFPTVVYEKVPILDEPEDGDTIPGDPGWTGGPLVERPTVVPPPKPKRKRNPRKKRGKSS